MAKYTLTLLEMAEDEMERGCIMFSGINAAVSFLRKYLFSFPYELYDNAHKEVLERKFIMKYLMNEIGFETPALFRYFLEEKFNRILPYYNMLYHMMDILEKLNLLVDRDMRIEESETARQRQVQKKDYSESQKTSELHSQSEKTDTSTSESEKTSTSESESESTVNHVDYTDNSRETGKENRSVSGIVNNVGTSNKKTGNSGQEDTITQDNRGISDFPQGNVADTKNQYYTTGEDGNQKIQKNHSNTANESTSEANSSSTSESESGSNESSSSAIHSETKEGMQYKYRDAESAAERDSHTTAYNDAVGSREAETTRLLDELNRLRNLMKKEGDKHEYGLTGSRTVASMIEEYKNTWVNVDEQIIDECRDLFMLVY